MLKQARKRNVWIPPPAARGIVAIDVAYGDDDATAACVAFDSWRDAEPVFETVVRTSTPAPYVSGELYRRELPCLLRVLGKLPSLPPCLIVDGFVWLDDRRTAGLGGHLWHALDERVAVIGVAKSPFRPLPPCVPVLRGHSRRPLYVSAAGMTPGAAAERIASMHGEHRIPTLLRRVDRLSHGTRDEWNEGSHRNDKSFENLQVDARALPARTGARIGSGLSSREKRPRRRSAE